MNMYSINYVPDILHVMKPNSCTPNICYIIILDASYLYTIQKYVFKSDVLVPCVPMGPPYPFYLCMNYIP